MRRRTWYLGEPLALQGERVLEPLDDIDLLEQLDALRERDVGCVGGRVRERPGLGDRAKERADALVGVAKLQDLFHDCAVLALELTGLDGRRIVVLHLGHLDAELAAGVRVGGADDAAVEAGERDGAGSAGQADAVGHLGHGADLRVLGLMPGHEQDAILVADVDRQRDGHAREHHGVLERDEQQVAQS